MSEFNIEVSSNTSVRLPTAGKYCDRDIVVTATGGGGDGGYGEGFEAGQQTEYDRFWDAYQQNGSRKHYSHAFAGHGWTLDICKPKYSMQPTDAYMMFMRNQSIANVPEWLAENGISIDFSQATSAKYVFSESEIEEVGVLDFRKCTNLYALFDNCTKLKTIGTIMLADGTSLDYMFGGCAALENVTIEGVISKSVSFSTCSKLTHDSLISIINALKDYSGSGTNYKLTLHATAKARLSTAEIAVATQKGWTIA